MLCKLCWCGFLIQREILRTGKAKPFLDSFVIRMCSEFCARFGGFFYRFLPFSSSTFTHTHLIPKKTQMRADGWTRSRYLLDSHKELCCRNRLISGHNSQCCGTESLRTWGSAVQVSTEHLSRECQQRMLFPATHF